MNKQSPPDKEPAREPADWRLWPSSPKLQIVLIAAGIALFNLMLLVIWAIVVMTQSG